MMGTYFKPLRRKFGVVTLGLACVLATCWIISRDWHTEFVPMMQVELMNSGIHVNVWTDRVLWGELMIPPSNRTEMTIPYWSIVIPLTLLSALLLLSKPPANIEPPIPENRKP